MRVVSGRFPSSAASSIKSDLEYVCLKTKPMSNFPHDIPIVHDPDERFYIQPLADQSILLGGFLRNSRAIFFNGVPDTFNYSLLPDNWDDFRMYFSNASLLYAHLFAIRLDIKQCYQTPSNLG